TDEVCRVRPGGQRCRHGIAMSCSRQHETGDPLVGQPVCGDCYDYTGHILWHGAVPEVWRRTVIYLYRALARLASQRTGERGTVRTVRDGLRVSYVRVAEFQKRGAVHLHAVIRLDGVDADDPDRVVTPPVWADAVLLEEAIRDAASRVQVGLPQV